MNEDLTTFIVKELGKHRNRKDVIRKICERGGLNWREAERLFVLVKARHKSSIAPSQSPLLLILSIGTLLLGIGLLAYNLQILFAFLQEDTVNQILSLQGSSYRLIGVITGLGVTAVGMAGLWRALGAIFPES